MSPATVRIPTPSMAFPTLQVSSRDAKSLELIADAHVQDTLEHYREFICDHKESVDRKMWHKVRSHHGVRVFRERTRSAIKRERFEKSGSSIKTRGSIRDEDDREPVTPLVMLVGTLQGNLDDVLYAIQSPTTETMQLQTSYVQDGLSDWAVLASILKPSHADPFRELSVKWAVKKHAMPLGALLRPRDLVYMESIGYTTTKSGERIGYQVKHSVDLAGAQELSAHGIVRANMSFCYIYRQRSENVVDVYMRGTISPLTSSALSNRASCSVATDIALSVARVSYCAQMKKLSWLLKTAKRASCMTGIFASPTAGRQQCTVCSENVSPSRKAHKKSCRICCERVCMRCRVTKNVACITSLDDQDVVVTTDMRFCTQCIHRASQVNAQCVALHDVVEAEGARDPDRAFDIIRKLRIDSISTCSLDDDYSQDSFYTQ